MSPARAASGRRSGPMRDPGASNSHVRRQGGRALPRIRSRMTCPGRRDNGPASPAFQKCFGVRRRLELCRSPPRRGEESQPECIDRRVQESSGAERLAHSRRFDVCQVLVAEGETPGYHVEKSRAAAANARMRSTVTPSRRSSAAREAAARRPSPSPSAPPSPSRRRGEDDGHLEIPGHRARRRSFTERQVGDLDRRRTRLRELHAQLSNASRASAAPPRPTLRASR